MARISTQYTSIINQKDANNEYTQISHTYHFFLIFAGCGVLPIKAEIKENHFRIENFKKDQGDDLEYVYLMCRNKKPTNWFGAEQHEQGPHNLWVTAKFSRRGIEHSERVAFINFKVNLAANKSYMLNRRISEGRVSVWLQEIDTGEYASEVITTQLERPKDFKNAHNLKIKQCKSSSV
ncbi:hypothetical protein [Thalassotalea atypica]|uniref:hypothetical protein n=1 Tax=Thalassotalea atypica TaxID=2054316 RepID=UPI00257235FD|nr:hypothetical protein [Thalassotalea atypica]